MSNKKPSKLQETLKWYFALFVLFLFFAGTPMLCSIFYLSQVPDIIIWQSDDNLTYTRIWMYDEGRPLGIGYESRQINRQVSETELCIRTKLRFLLWAKSERAKPATTYYKMIMIDGKWKPTGEECRLDTG